MQEQLDESQEQLATLERDLNRRMAEAEVRHDTLLKTYNQLKEDFEAKSASLQTAKQGLAKSDDRIVELEGELMTSRAQGGDVAELEMLRRELSEQVAHIRQLEKTGREQREELNEYKQQRKRIELVEEEKRDLEERLRMADEARKELGQAQVRIQVLEGERRAWTTYLESQTVAEEELRFESPEDLARAFMQVRVEKATLAEKLGAIQPELMARDERIVALETALAQARTETQSAKSAGGVSSSDAKAKARLERQKTLAIKEAEYLRAQLKAITDEEKEQRPEAYSEEQGTRIQKLEELVENYRREVERLHSDLSSLETQQEQPPSTPRTGTKRSLEDSSDERLGELLRRNRQLQDELSKVQTRNQVLDTEVSAQSIQLASLKATSRTRILELKNNPTATAEKIKQSTLKALQSENETLRAQLEGGLPTISAADAAGGQQQLVPRASLDALKLQLDEKDETITSREKSLQRLRSIFRAKGLEFREAVFSLLGWRLDFEPNGRVKATSMFYPKPPKRKDSSEDGGVDEVEGSSFILFDGEQGTMKVSGGPQSQFAKEIRSQIEFWVDGRGQVPCLLAAMTLEFYEKYGIEGVPGKG